MHDINFSHEHEIQEHDFLGCCKDCRKSLEIIKPHIMGFEKKIRLFTLERLSSLAPAALYRLYQTLDDLAHMDTGDHLAQLILDEPDIRRVLPAIRAYYSAFFTIHENNLAKELLASGSPWPVLEGFPLFRRYEALVKSQVEAAGMAPATKLLFLGCGPVPLTLILFNRLYGIRSLGLDYCPDTVKTAKRVIRKLGMEEEIEIIRGDHTMLGELSWDMLLVAALAEPKAEIFNALGRSLKKRKNGASVVYRTYGGMRAMLHRPVSSGDIDGFRIVKRIPPSGRVNNTIVLTELDR